MKRLGILMLLSCTLFVAGFSGYRGYIFWQQKHLLAQARAFVAKSDLSSARLCLIQALQQRPSNEEATRLLAELARAANSPEALSWRSRPVQLQPEGSNPPDLARTALCLGSNLATGESEYLNTLMLASTEDPAKAAETVRWLLLHRKPQEALAWITSLPCNTQTNLPALLLQAECYLAMHDWAGLLSNLEKQTWSELDCLRLACRARAFREQARLTSAQAEWVAALRAAQARRDLLLRLLCLTSLWNWAPEQEDVLWALVKHYPVEPWPAQVLAQRLSTTGRTQSLLSLYAQLVQNDSTNLALINNLALTSLLLQAWEHKPLERARQVYTNSPNNRAFASTYAYSLLVQQRPSEALKVIEQLNTDTLHQPEIAAYYGIILRATGGREKAREYLRIASQAHLLPEEKKLVDRALTGL